MSELGDVEVDENAFENDAKRKEAEREKQKKRIEKI